MALRYYILDWISSLFVDNFEAHSVDGRLLLSIDDDFAQKSLNVQHSLKRRKLVKLIDSLRLHQSQNEKVPCEMNEIIFADMS